MDHAQAEQPTGPAADILRAVGWGLVVVGLLDIGLMTYCITNGIDYSSPLNVFAIAGGILLLRQSLRSAKVVAWIAAFHLALLTGAVLLALPRVLTEGALSNLSVLDLGYIAALFILFAWLYQRLTSEAVLSAYAAHGLGHKKPFGGFIAGGVLVVGLATTFYGHELWGKLL